MVDLKTDEEIIERLVQEDETGLADLIDKYTALLKSVIQKHLYTLPNHQEECLNDVLLAIWKHADQYDSQKSSFKNWICAIARYRSINYLKKYRHEIKNVTWEETINDKNFTNDEPLARELWEIQLAELLAPLNKRDQQLFKDLFDSAYSTDEIATKHQMTKGALYNRLSRGRVKIRDFFQKKGDARYEERK